MSGGKKRGENVMSASLKITIPVWLDLFFVWPVLLYRRLKFGYTFRKIPLGEGRFTIVEPRDYYRLNRFHWYAVGQDDLIYAVRNVIKPGVRSKSVSMHRELMNAPEDRLVDHRNNDALDNRMANLRLATYSQNRINSRRDKSKTSSKYIGVCLDKSRNRWVAYINFESKRIHLRRFKNEIDAAKAYDEAARKYHGEFARLNFPEDTDKH